MRNQGSIAGAAAPPFLVSARALQSHANFDLAIGRFKDDLRAYHLEHRRAANVFADIGQLAIVATMLASSPPATEADICRLAGAGALASRRRVRSHIKALETAGLAQIRTSAGDRRARVVVPTAELERVLNLWVRALAGSAAHLFDLNAAVLTRSDLARFYLAQVMAAHRAGHSAFAYTPAVARLVSLSRGHALVLELLSEALQAGATRIRFSRRSFAQTYGVSRTHVIDLIGECDALGLVSVPSVRELSLSAAFMAEARLWAAINFTLARATLRGKLLAAFGG